MLEEMLFVAFTSISVSKLQIVHLREKNSAAKRAFHLAMLKVARSLEPLQ